MAWLQLAVRCRQREQARVEAALEDLGAIAVTLLDAEAETPNERAVLEPGVGEMPLWDTLVVQGLFAVTADRRGLLAALSDLVPTVRDEDCRFEEVADQDWERAWLDQYAAMQFGRRLWIYPWTIEPPADPDSVVVRLDPGLAFGTGTHPTTALCLQWLESMPLHGCTLLDLGCGSGVLAIAALKLGATAATGIDNDPQALLASRDNAVRNGVGDALELFDPEQAPARQYDVVVANILANALDALAPRIAAACRPGASLALSGILDGQQDALLSRYGEWFESLAVTRREDWLRIDGRRRG